MLRFACKSKRTTLPARCPSPQPEGQGKSASDAEFHVSTSVHINNIDLPFLTQLAE